MSGIGESTDQHGGPDGVVLPPIAVRRKEAARLLGISERLLTTLTQSGRVPHLRLGKAVLYPVNAVLAWAEREAEKTVRRRSGPREA